MPRNVNGSLGYVLTCLLAIVETGCGGTADAPVDENPDLGVSRSRLKRATPVAADDLLGVVRVFTGRGMCTGTVIGPDTIRASVSKPAWGCRPSTRVGA